MEATGRPETTTMTPPADMPVVKPDGVDKPRSRHSQPVAPREPDPPTASDTIWPIKITLTKAILDSKAEQKITEIEFREPTGTDIVTCGMPLSPRFEDGIVIMHPDKMTLMMARLSMIPPPFIQSMNSRDWTTCAMALQRFFLPDWAQAGSPV